MYPFYIHKIHNIIYIKIRFLIRMLNPSINDLDMLTIFINKLLFICNKHTPLPNITKYRYPIHIKNY